MRIAVLARFKARAAKGTHLLMFAGIEKSRPTSQVCLALTARDLEPERWGWEIRRRSKPLGVKMTGDGYQSDTAAQFAGKRALADFLIELSKEEKRSR